MFQTDRDEVWAKEKIAEVQAQNRTFNKNCRQATWYKRQGTTEVPRQRRQRPTI